MRTIKLGPGKVYNQAGREVATMVSGTIEIMTPEEIEQVLADKANHQKRITGKAKAACIPGLKLDK